MMPMKVKNGNRQQGVVLHDAEHTQRQGLNILVGNSPASMPMKPMKQARGRQAEGHRDAGEQEAEQRHEHQRHEVLR
jgi:fatty acid desaturase